MCGMITYWEHGALSALSGFVKKRHTRHFLQHRNGANDGEMKKDMPVDKAMLHMHRRKRDDLRKKP